MELTGWTMTRDEETGNYTLTCLDSNFDTQEKKIQVDCGNRAMTGDLVVDVKAKTGSVSIPSTSFSLSPNFTYSNTETTAGGTYAQVYVTSQSKTISPTVTNGWVDSVGDSTASVGALNCKAYSSISKYTKLTSPIDKSHTGDIGDNLEIGTVYSYQMIQSLEFETAGQYCRIYARGFYDGTSAATAVTYDGHSGYCLKGIDDGDLLVARFDGKSGSYYYWTWLLLRTNGTQTQFGRTRSLNPSYSFIEDVRLDKQGSDSEKALRITLNANYYQII